MPLSVLVCWCGQNLNINFVGTSCRRSVDRRIDFFKHHHTNMRITSTWGSSRSFSLISPENGTGRETWQQTQRRTLGGGNFTVVCYYPINQRLPSWCRDKDRKGNVLLHGRGRLWDWRVNPVTAQGSCCAFRTSNLHLCRKLSVIYLPKQWPALYSYQHLRDFLKTTTLPKCSC